VKILIVGGGPGGLYSGLLLKKANPGHDITLIERNPRDATYGWGVVFSDRTLTSFREADYKTYKEITDRFVIWSAIDVWYQGELIRCDGHAFAGLARKRLLAILQNRCQELGVKLKFETEFEVDDMTRYQDVDLIVAADGINSKIREAHAEVFQPSLDVGKAKYIWYGTTKVFDSFTFIFRENEHGLFQVHAYPFDGSTGTFIIECAEDVWHRAGLDEADEAESIAYCENLFAPDLGRGRLMSNYSRWINFVRVKNKRWRHHNLVLLGDAVHTAHFSIGSGTKLAMEDAIAFANAFEHHGDDLDSALNEYALERKPIVDILQRAALESRTYFENVYRYTHLEPHQFAFYLMTRSGRITYDNLRQRDPIFVQSIDRWFATQASTDDQTGLVVAPAPMFAPFKLRELTLSNRVVLSPTSTYSAGEGLPNETHQGQLLRRARAGASLILTEPVAVSAQGRITPGCTGMYDEEHLAAWKKIVDSIHINTPTKIALQLSHAGRRGSTRPRSEGLDRPLLTGNWPLLSASPLPYTPADQTPKTMDRADMDRVRDEFVRAATLADEAGFDMIQLHFAQGYLLAGFLSPLTNQRQDDYGGSPENRLRFPLEVFDAVRAVWPADKPISVAVPATDWEKGGLGLDDGVAIAEMLKTHGCDLIQALAGQTTPKASPVYGSGFLTPLNDWLRNNAHVPTMTMGHITTTDEVNTILAAGRADLVIMNPLKL
jgi:anthraniloyl-CoA monooxygenase